MQVCFSCVFLFLFTRFLRSCIPRSSSIAPLAACAILSLRYTLRYVTYVLDRLRSSHAYTLLSGVACEGQTGLPLSSVRVRSGRYCSGLNFVLVAFFFLFGAPREGVRDLTLRSYIVVVGVVFFFSFSSSHLISSSVSFHGSVSCQAEARPSTSRMLSGQVLRCLFGADDGVQSVKGLVTCRSRLATLYLAAYFRALQEHKPPLARLQF